jgi:hypothetical protein
MNAWVYSRNTDLSVFGSALLLALLQGILIPRPEAVGLVFLYYFLDTPHRVSTFFYTLNSDRINSTHHRYFFWGIPIVVYLLSALMIMNNLFPILFKIYAHASLFHFMKQSQAWMMISAKKTLPQSAIENGLNTAAIYCAVWVPQIISMTFEQPTGWFRAGDIVQLPSFFRDFCVVISLGVGLLYLAQELKRWTCSHVVLWGKHFHLLVGLAVWVIGRLRPLDFMSPSLGIFIMLSCHTIPYFYLSHRYTKDRYTKNEKFWFCFKQHSHFFMWAVVCCLLITTLEYSYLYFFNFKSEYLTIVIMTSATTHYLYDSYLWKKNTHPEGAAVLS